MKHLSDSDVDRLIKLTKAVMEFNDKEYDARMTLKYHQDRVELVIYRGRDNGGLRYDANFTTVGRHNFETDLTRIEEVVKSMSNKFFHKKEAKNGDNL